jgi:hypothetical protein
MIQSLKDNAKDMRIFSETACLSQSPTQSPLGNPRLVLPVVTNSTFTSD